MLRHCFSGVLACASIATAQCTPTVLPGTGTMGFWRIGSDAYVDHTATWDPDGSGPATPVVVFAGYFDHAGNVPARRLATWDPATGVWSAVGGGFVGTNDVAFALHSLPNGALVVGGSFTTIGGVTANGVAQWNGTAWSAFGTGLANRVRCFAQLPNGDLLAGGDTSLIPGSSLARWNGTAWVAFGTSINGSVLALEVLPGGDVVAGGYFTQAGGVAVQSIARWNGTAWLAYPPVPTITATEATQDLALMANGDLVVARSSRVLRFGGTNWSTFGATPYEVGYGTKTLLPMPNGELWVGGDNSVQAAPNEHVYRWNGTAWVSVGGGCAESVQALVRLANGDVIAVGGFDLAGGRRVDCAARWDGTAWQPLSRGSFGTVFAVATTLDGGHVVGGEFTTMGGVACRNVARFQNGAWQPLGSGVDGRVRCVLARSNSDIVVAGEFLEAGGLVTRRIARWNGTAWSPLGSGCNWLVHALAELPNGDLVATGEFTQAGGVAVDRIARWNGSVWSPLAGGGIDHRGLCLFVQQNGELLVGGEFTQAGAVAASNVARWDGSVFHSLGAGSAYPVSALTVDDAGGVLAGRIVTNQGLLVRYDGSTWSTIPGMATSYMPVAVVGFARVPGGDIVVAGQLPPNGGGSSQCLWRLANGTVSSVATNDGLVHAIARNRDQEIVVGGSFTVIDGAISTRVARLVPPCAPQTTAIASGCVGVAPTLAAASPPWLGETARFESQGLGPNAIAIAVVGLTALATPLTALHPAGSPGCLLLASPDATLALVPANGAVTWSLPVPSTPALVGSAFRSQAVAVEFAPAGLQALTTSNGLVSTLGIW